MSPMNEIVTTPSKRSPAFWFRMAARLAALITPTLTVVSLLVQPKNPALAVAILAVGAPLTGLLNSLHAESVRQIALDAAWQAANLGPIPSLPSPAPGPGPGQGATP